MKLPYDNYAANLRKLERMQEVATQNAPRPVGTVSALVDGSQPEATPEPAFGLVQQSRTGGFGALGRLDREVDSVLDTNPSKPVELYEAEDPDLPSNKGKRRIMERKIDDEDEWGGDELNDDLLPM